MECPKTSRPEPGADDSGSSFDEFLARYMAGERARAAAVDRPQPLPQRAHAGDPAARRPLRPRARPARARRPARAARARRPRIPRRTPSSASAPTARAIARATEERLPAASATADVDGAVITASVQRALFHAFQVARSSGSTYVDPEHLFFALVLAQDTPAGQVLAQRRRDRRGAHPGHARDRHADRRARRRRARRMPRHPRPRCSTSSAPT